MRPHVIVLAQPLTDNELCLPGRCEPLGIEYFMAQPDPEALNVATP